MENNTLKLVSLNCWGGCVVDKLIPFFEEKGKEIDIFCCQEMFDCPQSVLAERHPDRLDLCGDVFKRASAVLPDHEGTLAYFDDDRYRMTLAMFIRRGVEIKTLSDFVVYRPVQPIETGNVVRSARKLQYTTFMLNDREYTVANFHGLWVNGPKTDTPERLEQARAVRTFLDSVSGPAMLCGDFNLLPDTESLRIMRGGWRDLVKESGASSTRTPLYRHYNNSTEPNFADYILVSPEVDVKKFAVLPDVVSDHAPLYVEFS